MSVWWRCENVPGVGRVTLNVKRHIQACTLVVVTTLAVGLVAPSAYAAPTAAQVKAVKDQVEALEHQVEAASEDYNEAAAKLASATAKRKKAEARLAQATARMKELRGNLNDRAVAMYHQGPAGFIEVLLGVESFDDFATVWEILNDMNEQDAANLDELEVLKAEAVELRATLVAQEKAAKAAAATMKARETSIKKKLVERESKLAGMEAQVNALREAEERARASSIKSYDWPDKPLTNAPRGSVVTIAKKYLGVPYKWAGSSPSTGFDCSGFTLYVYRQVGVKLPHSSRAQINVGQRVPRSELAPGDLVFFGSPIHHVGIYVGGGRYIHAPHTGAVVRIDSMNRSGYAGASRP